MSARTSFLRYTFIIKKLRNFKQASFEEINEYLFNEFGLLDEPVKISKRTLQRDLNEIFYLPFGNYTNLLRYGPKRSTGTTKITN